MSTQDHQELPPTKASTSEDEFEYGDEYFTNEKKSSILDGKESFKKDNIEEKNVLEVCKTRIFSSCSNTRIPRFVKYQV